MGCGAIQPQIQQKNLQTIQTLSQIYQRKQLIGKGTYGKVYRCINKLNNTQYALKVIQLNSKTKQEAIRDINNLKGEISVLKKLNHPNIIKYYNFQVSHDLNSVEIVLELVNDGSLKDQLQKKGPFDQNKAANYCQQILNGLCYLHRQKIIHRDLKCANILVNKEGIIKITDFGTAKVINYQINDDVAKLSASLKGTPYYMAPQVLKRKSHTFSADIWSFGCTVIEMISGKAPWTGISKNFQEIIGYIAAGIHPPLPQKITKQCQFFIESCLDTIPSKRLTAQQLLCHEFLIRTKRKHSQRDEPIINQNKSLQKYIDTQIVQSIVKNKKSIQNQQLIKNNKSKSNHKSKKSNAAKIIDDIKDQQIQQLYLENQIDISLEHQRALEGLHYIKKNMKKKNNKKKSNHNIKISKTSATVKMTQQNILGQEKIPQFDYNLRSNTQFSHENQAINTTIARAQRNRYIQERKKIRQLKDQQKRKWQRQLKQGAQILKNELPNRYLYTQI